MMRGSLRAIMLSLVSLLFFIRILLVLATSFVVKERTVLPSGLNELSDFPYPNETIVLRIGLAHSDVPSLETMLYYVSDPHSIKYGQHLPRDATLAFLKPAAATTAAIDAWLASHGLTPSRVSPQATGIPQHHYRESIKSSRRSCLSGLFNKKSGREDSANDVM